MMKHFLLKSRIVLAIVLCFLCVANTMPVSAKTTTKTTCIYVAKNGNDKNNGSSKKPYKTLTKALKVAKAGTTIVMRSGTYKGTYCFKKSGSKSAYITVKAAKNAKVVLTAAKSKSERAVFDFNGQSYIKVSGLEISNVTALRAYGMVFRGGEKYISISNNNIHHIKTTETDGEGEANGILVFGGSKKAIRNVSITGNKVHDNVNGWSENISVAGNCQNIKVNKNRVYNNTNIGIDFAGNAGYCSDNSKDHPRNCEAVGNVVYNCKSDYAKNAGIYVDGAQDIKISGNKVYRNWYGIEVGSEIWKPKKFNNKDNQVKNISITKNNIYSNSDGGIHVGGYTAPGKKDPETGQYTGVVKNVTISGNVLKNNGSGDGGYNGEIFLAKCDTVKITGNKFYKTKAAARKYPWIGYDAAIKKAGGCKNITKKNNKYNIQ